MKRAFFSAVGVFLILMGLQCILVSRFVFHWTEEIPVTGTGTTTVSAPTSTQIRKSQLISRDWHAWSFVMPGVILLLYGTSLPKK